MASEIIGETHELSLRTLRFKAFAITEKDIHIGATETVDALLGITNRAHIGKAWLSKRSNQSNLKLVSILELINHDDPELGSVGIGNFRMIGQRVESHTKQVNVIDAGSALQALIFFINSTSYAQQCLDVASRKCCLYLPRSKSVGIAVLGEKRRIAFLHMVFGAGFRERKKGLDKASRFEIRILKRSTATVLQEIFVGHL